MMRRRARSAMDPLHPVLKHVEEELRDNLEKACEKTDVNAETTGELEKLSDTLSAAARQAKAAAGLRRRMNSSQLNDRLNQSLSPPRGEPTAGADVEKPGDDARAQ